MQPEPEGEESVGTKRRKVLYSELLTVAPPKHSLSDIISGLEEVGLSSVRAKLDGEMEIPQPKGKDKKEAEGQTSSKGKEPKGKEPKGPRL